MAFHPIDRDTAYLLPPSVQEWLPEAHFARYVVDVVEESDLSALERATYDSLAFRYIACNHHPDHDTLAVFRKRFGQEFQTAFAVCMASCALTTAAENALTGECNNWGNTAKDCAIGCAVGMGLGFLGKKVWDFARWGREISFGKNIRVAPFGNRTGHPYGTYPHYHRRGAPDVKGKTPDGQGIGRHHTWESKPSDKKWKDRF